MGTSALKQVGEPRVSGALDWGYPSLEAWSTECVLPPDSPEFDHDLNFGDLGKKWGKAEEAAAGSEHPHTHTFPGPKIEHCASEVLLKTKGNQERGQVRTNHKLGQVTS